MAAGDGQAQKTATSLRNPNILSTKKWKVVGEKPVLEHILWKSISVQVFGYVTNDLKSYGGFCFSKTFC